MGLLLQALAGGLGQGADTAANLMADDIKNRRAAAYQADRDKAQALREENLVRLRQQLSDSSDRQKELNKINDNYTVDDVPVSNQRLQEASAANAEKTGLINTMGARRQEAINQDGGEIQGDDGPQTSIDKIGMVQQAGSANPDEQAKLDELKGKTGNIRNVKADAASAAADVKVQLKDMDVAYREKALATQLEYKQKALDLQGQLLAAKVEHLRALDSKDTNNSLKALVLEQKKNENQRKAATEQAKMLNDVGGRIEQFSAEQLAVYRKLEQQAGGDGDRIPDTPPPKKEKVKESSWLGSINPFGDSGTQTPPPAKNVTPSVSYDTNSLPAGAVPVPGKKTKDGRPVYKSPDGNLIAPKLNTMKSH